MIHTRVYQARSGEMSIKRTKEPVEEYACHEGNYAMKSILGGAR